ncbi:MAG: SsrA-binding protein SmpB [Firmicutes bacterium]|nr:SsrA-binding protein SmpB [Bacillota bacterium]MBQ1888273.1 SsrA-binding protein SmpB [Bacillota bacterium]MBQ2455206.1 SsrA-binding protein SmpB [Bacillota bacterium]MBQ3577978.1 SsrA-binding protein SmpB [Bacillota bacterium]MBQ4234834.1 SsrA-binding protein SmpB [Bacillota bacterium]
MAEGKLISNNKKAYHDYFFEDTYEAGIVLTGCEIKSVRAGGVNLRDSFAKVEKGEIWVYNMHISPYEQGNRYNPDPMRPKKLLLNRQEIRRMEQAVTQKGLTLVPVKLYLNNRGRAKLQLAVARGKKLYDKRADLAKKDAARDMDRSRKNRGRDE